MRAQRIKITEPGWGGYTGWMGAVYFHDGVSVDLVAPIHMARVGALVRCEGLDDREQTGAGAVHANLPDVEAQVREELPRADESDLQAELEGKVEVTPTPAAPATVYTAESLAAVADEKGIAGLREIAEPMGVKGRGINELIAEILAHQAKQG